jgi:serine/threonine protein kinase
MHCRHRSRAGNRREETRTEVDKLPPPPADLSIGGRPDEPVSVSASRQSANRQLLCGRYQLEQSISKSGKVSAATDLVLRRRVAVRRLNREWANDAQLRDSFERSARALATVEHPNVVRILDLVVTDTTYVIMEFVLGPSLAHVIREHGALEPMRALRLATRLCWALDAIHSAGFVHGDIDATNVILGPDAEHSESPRLVGLAVATPSATALGSAQRHSIDDVADSETTSRRPNVRVDLDRLGQLLFFMLTANLPAAAEALPRRVRAELRQSLGAEAGTALCAVVERALGPARPAKFRSARDMACALRRVSRASTNGPARRSRRRFTTTRVLVAWALLLATVWLIAFAFARSYSP